jgi:hypothetical protein
MIGERFSPLVSPGSLADTAMSGGKSASSACDINVDRPLTFRRHY